METKLLPQTEKSEYKFNIFDNQSNQQTASPLEASFE
jgi:hypothetical protein